MHIFFASDKLKRSISMRAGVCAAVCRARVCENAVAAAAGRTEVTRLSVTSRAEGQGFHTQEPRRGGRNRSMMQIKIHCTSVSFINTQTHTSQNTFTHTLNK